MAALKLLPLGGLGEIGLNMMVVVYENDAFIIDSGIMFPDESMPGVDIVIPDIDPVLRQDWKLHGIVLTHGHEDHIGALPYVLKRIDVPVFATNLTMGFIEYKLEEFGLLDVVERNIVSPDEPITLGPFTIDFFSMCHSVADGVGLAVTTPEGVVLHSGDFKLDPTPVDGRLCDIEKITEYSRRGILALLSDSTNVEKSGSTRSESTIRFAFEKIFKQAKGRIIISTFSSNIHRMQQVFNLSEEFGRKVVLVGRSMESNARIASERHHLDIPPGILIEMKEMEYLPDEQLTVLSTGSQGEPMSALSLMASDRHKYLKVKTGDVIIMSSKFIPGNEKAINYVINEFCRRGADVKYEKISDVHVSGHASEEELRYLIRLVKPECFIPIHGEYRHLLRHARFAVEEGVPADRVLIAQDGDLMELSKDGVKIIDQVDTGKVFVHGKGVGEIGQDVLRDRRILAEVGLITVVLTVSKTDLKLSAPPQINSVGVTFDEIEPELLDGALAAVQARLCELEPKDVDHWQNTREEIRLIVRRHVNRILGRKPLVQTIIVWT